MFYSIGPWPVKVNKTEFHFQKNPRKGQFSISLDLVVHVVVGRTQNREHFLLGILEAPAVLCDLQGLPLSFEGLKNQSSKSHDSLTKLGPNSQTI